VRHAAERVTIREDWGTIDVRTEADLRRYGYGAPGRTRTADWHNARLVRGGGVSALPSPLQDRATRRQVEVLRAYIATGSIKRAAHELGISESTARQHLSGLYRRVGCENAAQAAYRLGASDGRAA